MNIKQLKDIIKDLPDKLEIDLCYEEWVHTDGGTSMSYEKSESLMSVHLIQSSNKRINKNKNKKIVLSTTSFVDRSKSETSLELGNSNDN